MLLLALTMTAEAWLLCLYWCLGATLTLILKQSNGFDPARELFDTVTLLSQEESLKSVFTKDFTKFVGSLDLKDCRDE